MRREGVDFVSIQRATGMLASSSSSSSSFFLIASLGFKVYSK
jgi:hypothetical protein